MLSILIPCYDYPTYDLVNVLFNQCKDLNIVFEILVSEDGGKTYLDDNKKIDNLDNCQYLINQTNLGRAGNINRLLKVSKYHLKLIVDCDVWPKTSQFISYYLNQSSKLETAICFGGIAYNKLNKTKNLRYNYGIKRESRPATYRQKNPIKSLLTSNILLKNCFERFDERINTYGYEDLVFAQNIYEKNIDIIHTDNPVYHNNLETNEVYLSKTQNALKTLISLEQNKIIKPNLTNISKIYHAFSRLYLNGILNLSYNIMASILHKHLLVYGRPIWLFDIYKLLFFSKHY
ncbi:MAG: glycosyltransferase [Bacteroidetes bacterium]|nr:glycosyltransferase [Bacteroidota bacterium]